MSLKELIYLIMIISISLEGHELSGQICHRWRPPKTKLHRFGCGSTAGPVSFAGRCEPEEYYSAVKKKKKKKSL